jgi:nucleotide-binding universal stress UspA family protein
MELMTADPTGTAMYSSAMIDSARLAGDLEAEAKAVPEKAARKLGKLMPNWAIAHGTCLDVPAHGLLQQAETWKPDLILIGSHGWSGFGKLLLGSVADRVLHHARTNVRIGRKAAKKRAGAPRLLIGFDGSPYAEAAVAEVAGRHWPKGTRVHLLAASSLQPHMGDVADSIRKALHRKGPGSTPWPWMERALDKAVTRLEKHDLKAKAMIEVADPRYALIQEAKTMGADCVFVGSRGLSGLDRFLVGSISTAVAAHAPCSVEVIHKP